MPLGVIAAISAWNVPMILLAAKIAPALLAGNTVVAKPAATTPLAALKLGELCADILPPGVINVIVDANDLGEALTCHPDVAKIAFTGSTATGRKVMESAAPTLKRLTLELGGNDAAIVLDDVNPKEIAPKLFAGATFNSGQGCVVIKRLYVHDSQYDEFCEELGRLAREAVVDDGAKPGAQIGPLQNKAHFERVKGFLKDAKQDGVIVAGGNVLQRKGYFVEPTIVRDIGDDTRLVREEQFGPILPVLRYAKVEDAIARERYGVRARRQRLVEESRAGLCCGLANQFGHGLDQQASQPAARHSLQGRQAVRHRNRTGPRWPGRIYPAQDHKYGQAAGLMRIPPPSRRRGKLSRARTASARKENRHGDTNRRRRRVRRHYHCNQFASLCA